jgi:hypothetical protein
MLSCLDMTTWTLVCIAQWPSCTSITHCCGYRDGGTQCIAALGMVVCDTQFVKDNIKKKKGYFLIFMWVLYLSSIT